MAARRAHVLVRGRVQGVFFRSETARRASALGLSGWVRNRADGAVEAVFEGPEERVSTMLAWCGRGPSRARVDGVETSWDEPRGEQGFAVR